MSASLTGTLSWKIIPCAQQGRRASLPRHQYDNLRCELTSSVLVGYEPTRAASRATAESPVVYLLVASMGEVRRLNRCSVAIGTAPTSGSHALPQNEYVVLTAADELEAQAWLEALCDAVEAHNARAQLAAARPAHPPYRLTSPHKHKYAPEPAGMAPPVSALVTEPVPSSPRRTSVRFASVAEPSDDISDEGVASVPQPCSSSFYSSTSRSDGDEDDAMESVPSHARPHKSRWRPNTKPLLSDVIQSGVYPSHPVLAPALNQLVSTTGDRPRSASPAGSPAGSPAKRQVSRERESPLRRHRRSTATNGGLAPSRLDDEGRADGHRPSSRGSNTRLDETAPQSVRPPTVGRRGDSTTRAAGPSEDRDEPSSAAAAAVASTALSSSWRWGPVEPGPAVPAVVAIASDHDSLHSTALLASDATARRRHSLTPLIQYGLPCARRHSASPESRSASLEPSRWRTQDPLRSSALVPFFAAPQRERSPFLWPGAPPAEARATSRERARGHRAEHKTRTRSRSHRRRGDNEDEDEDGDDDGYYRSSRARGQGSSRHRHSKRGTSRGSDRNPPIDDENVAFMCQPRLFLKYDVEVNSGRAPALHYVFLTVDVQHLVAVPAQTFETAIERAGLGKEDRRRSQHGRRSSRSKSSGARPTVAVRSLDRALEFFGKSCTAISLRSVLRVRRGCDEPMINSNPEEAGRFVDKGCVICVMSSKRAFLLESTSQEEASRVVDAFDSILADSIP